MSETFVTMTTFQQDLANLINRVAAGGERIVVVDDGDVKAAVIGIEELRWLEQHVVAAPPESDQYTYALTAADRLRGEVAQWQATHTVGTESVVETLRQLREGRDDELAGLC